MTEFACVTCKKKYDETRPLRIDLIKRCPDCRNELRRQQRRDTWHNHKAQYMANRKKKTQPALEQAAEQTIAVAPELESDADRDVGRLVDWPLANGTRVVWMSY